MWLFNSWLDYVRLANCVICIICAVLLVGGYIRNHEKYNEKTMDYWYGRMMWTLAGIIISFEGIRRDFPFTTIPLFVLIASLVTLKGLSQKGPWGYETE